MFFTSDSHFSHRLMTEMRGFESPEAMDEHLISEWNAIAPPDATIYHLGDWSIKKGRTHADALCNVLKRLNGRIFSILGNHDIGGFGGQITPNLCQAFESRGVTCLGHYHELRVDEQEIVLSHYPITSWNKMHHGSWALFGHCHDNLQSFIDAALPHNRCLDVGVDSAFSKFGRYAPLSFGQIAEFMSKKSGMLGGDRPNTPPSEHAIPNIGTHEHHLR